MSLLLFIALLFFIATINRKIIRRDRGTAMKQITILECKECGERFLLEDLEKIEEDLEEQIWDHLWKKHEGIFQKLEDFDTPQMIDKAYYRTVWVLKQ